MFPVLRGTTFIFLRMSLHCMLVPVQYREYEYGLLKIVLVCHIINILLTEPNRSVWENLDLSRVCRPQCVRSVLTASVKILPYNHLGLFRLSLDSFTLKFTLQSSSLLAKKASLQLEPRSFSCIPLTGEMFRSWRTLTSRKPLQCSA